MTLLSLRSLLFVPATSPQLVPKAADSGSDAVIVDLEDSVPPARKAEARAMAAEAIERLDHAGRSFVLLRVNADPALWQADIDAVPLDRIGAVMLPKVESASQVGDLQEALTRRRGRGQPAMPIVALVETARGVLHAEHIAAAGNGLRALGFGAEDYAGEMGVAPRPASLLWPAQKVSTSARAFGLACWGLPGSIAEIADMDAFAELVTQGREVGFTGTVCIHPRQVAVANAGFGPTHAEIGWARKVVAAAEMAESMGLGAVQLEGKMIDRPVVERARRWLA